MTILYERRAGVERRQYDHDIPEWMSAGLVSDRRKAERVAGGVSGLAGDVFGPAMFDDVPTMELLPELRPFWLEGLVTGVSAK